MITRWTLVLIMCAFAHYSCRRDARTDTAADQVRPPSQETPQVTTLIELSGAGIREPQTFTYRQLAGMPMTRLDNVLMRKSREDDELTSWEGPTIAILLERAGLQAGPMDVSIEAEDGYVMELDLSDLNDAIVAMKSGDGRWLADLDEDCPLKLVPPHKPGNFWVMNPSRIVVEPAANTDSSK